MTEALFQSLGATFETFLLAVHDSRFYSSERFLYFFANFGPRSFFFLYFSPEGFIGPCASAPFWIQAYFDPVLVWPPGNPERLSCSVPLSALFLHLPPLGQP